jgi:hypothetical protein
MAQVTLMPRLSDTMTEGVIAAWHKKVGDYVKKGDILAEIETDKATMELESYQDGVLLHIGTPLGGKLQVNDLLAIFGKPGEDISEILIKYQIDNSNVLPIYEQPHEITIDLPKQLLQKVRYNENYQFVIVNWYKNEGDSFITGDNLFDIVIDDKIYKIGINISGTLIQIIKKLGSNLNNSWPVDSKGKDICSIKCFISEMQVNELGIEPPLYILDSFFYFRQLEEHPYLNYSKVQLDLYERFLEIELKAAKIIHLELERNDSNNKQQPLIKKEEKEKEKENEDNGWLIYIILFPFILSFILKLIGINISEIFITGVFSASILAAGIWISKKT